jgi:hypothetical protein
MPDLQHQRGCARRWSEPRNKADLVLGGLLRRVFEGWLGGWAQMVVMLMAGSRARSSPGSVVTTGWLARRALPEHGTISRFRRRPRPHPRPNATSFRT